MSTKALTPETPHANGAIAMPIKEAEIDLSDIGYTGWIAYMRLNPRSEVFDRFIGDDQDKSWEAFGQLVLRWNFLWEDGSEMPLPSKGLKKDDLPTEVIWALNHRYMVAFNERTQLPKLQEETSKDT